MLSGSLGGTGVTASAENMGVMAMTRIFSSLVFVVAGLTAILFGLCPKFGQLILTIPVPVIGGLSVVVFGLVGQPPVGSGSRNASTSPTPATSSPSASPWCSGPAILP